MPELLPIQLEAIEVIQKAFAAKKHKGFILADTMGIGKTAPAIELVKQSAGVCLIVCPAYLLYNWTDELIMWGIDLDDVCIIDSGKQILQNKRIYLVGYSWFVRDRNIKNKKEPHPIIKQILKKQFSLVVCDEGHYLKAWNSDRSSLILGTNQNKRRNILCKSDNILLLTGTPILNRIEELYNIVIRIAPAVLDYMSKWSFYQIYAGWLDLSGFAPVAHGVKNEKDLQKRLAPILLRRTKIEGLKDRIDETIKLNPNTPELKKLFAEEESFLQEHGITASNVEAITKLSKIETSKISEVRQRVALCKIPVYCEMLADTFEEYDGPVLVYCYHRAVLKALVSVLSEKFKDKKVLGIDGGTDTKKRHEIVKAYQAGKIDVLCATDALSEGLNVTRGSVVDFIELGYVPATIEQKIGRVHRRGQEQIVRVRKIVFNAGIEKRILQILVDKQKTIDKVLK